MLRVPYQWKQSVSGGRKRVWKGYGGYKWRSLGLETNVFSSDESQLQQNKKHQFYQLRLYLYDQINNITYRSIQTNFWEKNRPSIKLLEALPLLNNGIGIKCKIVSLEQGKLSKNLQRTLFLLVGELDLYDKINKVTEVFWKGLCLCCSSRKEW